MNSSIDSDGLPYIGHMINPKDPLYRTYDTLTSTRKPTLVKGSEPVFVDNVTVVGTASKRYLQKVNIRTRRIRNSIIGDKFSSRHGQKGVCSHLWPDIDMPFSSVTGMRPDLIINPHAFPSRMTIGMLLESIAAKAGSLNGKFIDATCKGDGNKRSEQSSLVDELGPMLASHGFNYHGSEVLYNGYYGTEMNCEIFIGPVYYINAFDIWSPTNFRFDPLGLWTRSPGSQSEEGNAGEGSGLVRWSATQFSLTELPICCMIVSTRVLIIT